MAEPPDVESFSEWDLGDEVQASIAAMGITKPTPIQALSIGAVLEGKDVIAKAETGTGKTLAFGAPMIARIDPHRACVLGLVLSPTRELAEQVFNVLTELGESRGMKTVLIVGGEEMGPQVKALQGGAQVVVGTPGRVLDLMNQGFLSFPWTEFAILDEADKMLEIGFIDDVKKILEACNEYRQTLLFSATFPTPLLTLARAYTREPVEVATSLGMSTVDTISQRFLKVTEDGRVRALARLIDTSDRDDVFLVFCDRRTDVDRLLRRLERERFSVKALHGGYDQASRFRVMSAFRSGTVKALLATDVASRGLDVAHVTHVVNYGVPRDVSDYTHRIGRTGRAGREGTSVTLVGPGDQRRWRDLLRTAPYEIAELDSPTALARESARSRDRRPDRAPEGNGAAPRSGKDGERDEPQRSRGRDRSERPKREDAAPSRAPAEEPVPASAPAADPDTPFGEGIAGEKPQKKKPRRQERPEKRAPAAPARPVDEPTASDFGAGL